MTEEEARTKWCPFSRPELPRADDCGYQAGNRAFVEPGGDQTTERTRCLGSACMAWRAHTKSWNATVGRWVEPERAYLSSDIIEQRPTDEGHCGLAGKP